MFTRNHCALKTLTLAVLLAASAGTAIASDKVWAGYAGDYRWNNAGNWIPSGVPTANDDVYIYAPRTTTITANGGVARHVYSTASLIVVGNDSAFAVHGGGEVFGEFLMLGSSVYTYNAPLQLHADYNVWQGGFFRTDTTKRGGVEVMPGAYMQIGSGGAVGLGCDFRNSGTVDFTNGGIAMQVISGSGVIVLDNNGIWRNDTGTWIDGYGSVPTFVFNEAGGGWSYGGASGNVRISGNTSFWNNGAVSVGPGIQLTLPNWTNIGAAGGPLDRGSWYLNNGVIRTDGRPITAIGPNAWVGLTGAAAQFDGLYRAQTIEGTLFIDGDADMTLSPSLLGTVQNYGTLAVGAGSHLRINGGYWQRPGAVLRRFVDNSGPSPVVGVFDTLLSSTVGGDLSVEFYSDNLAPGQEFSMIEMAPLACCGISGAFDNVTVSSNGTHHVVVRYDLNDVKAVVPTCPADFNGDEFVTGDDFDAYVEAFQAGAPDADYNADGFVTGDDFDAYVDAFEVGC